MFGCHGAQVSKMDASWQAERTGMRDRLERMQKVLPAPATRLTLFAGRECIFETTQGHG